MLHDDLENNWQVVTEAIQTILRREGVEKPYEKLKELSRGKQINKETINKFVLGLSVSEDVKAELLALSPHSYIGVV